MKKALIVGCEGQDGTYLTRYLQKKRYHVIGIGGKKTYSWKGGQLKPVNISKPGAVLGLLKQHKPDEIYYLAAYHHSSQDRKENDAVFFQRSFDVHVYGLIHFLGGMRAHCSKARLFYAASSLVFGNPHSRVQNEKTPFAPVCIYGITKTAGVQTCRFYRREYGLYASAGILYNHESPLRADKFVSQKIVRTAVAIQRGEQKELVLGNLNAVIDWGFAGDYVEAMHRMLSLQSSDDFIIASGKAHTVKEFVEGVFKRLKLNWTKYVREDAQVIQRKQQNHWQGDPSKIKRMTGWSPKADFSKLIAIMVDAELKNNG